MEGKDDPKDDSPQDIEMHFRRCLAAPLVRRLRPPVTNFAEDGEAEHTCACGAILRLRLPAGDKPAIDQRCPGCDRLYTVRGETAM